MTKDNLFKLGVVVITAVLFWLGGFQYAKKVLLAPKNAQTEIEREFINQYVGVLQAERKDLYRQLAEIPDQNTIVQTKIIKQKVFLNEKIQQHKRLDQNNRIIMFHDLVHQLDPMPDTIR